MHKDLVLINVLLSQVNWLARLRRKKLLFLSWPEENRLSLSRLRSSRDTWRRKWRYKNTNPSFGSLTQKHNLTNTDFIFYRPRTPWPMLSSLPAMTVTCSESSLRRSRRPRLSCREACPRPTVRWLSGDPNMRLMPSSALRSWRRPSMLLYFCLWHSYSVFLFSFNQFQHHFIKGKSLPSACRRLRNPLRLWTPSVPLWRRPSRDCRVRWRTSWLMWRELMLWLPTLTRSRGTLTR